MPSKIQLDENLWFLYICLQKSDLKSLSSLLTQDKIDFAAVGQATNLKPPAARMRYTRLKKQIESGTLIGTHGTPFTAEKIKEGARKRKCATESPALISPVEKIDSGEGIVAAKNKDKGMEKEVEVKEEKEGSDWSSESEEDSEDEMPLAKLRKGRKLDDHTTSPRANAHIGMGHRSGSMISGEGQTMMFAPFFSAPSRRLQAGKFTENGSWANGSAEWMRGYPPYPQSYNVEGPT